MISSSLTSTYLKLFGKEIISKFFFIKKPAEFLREIPKYLSPVEDVYSVPSAMSGNRVIATSDVFIGSRQ